MRQQAIITSNHAKPANLTRRKFIALSAGIAVSMMLVGCSANSDTANQQKNSNESEVSSESNSNGLSETQQLLLDDQKAIQQTPIEQIPQTLALAQTANSDVCAWLYVPQTNVNLPIAQGESSYYLKHNYAGIESATGAAYMEPENARDFSDKLTVIYGHSFSDEEVLFTQLNKLESQETFDAVPLFYIIHDGKIAGYRILSAMRVSDTNILDTINADNVELFQAYLNFLAEPTEGLTRDIGVPNAETDKIVQLSTCTVPAQNGVRFVVTGVFFQAETF